MRRVLVVAWLTALWVVMWRELSAANLLAGLAIGTVAELARPWRALGQREHAVRPLALLSFAAYFLVKLVESNIVLAREVLTPRNSIETGVIEVPLGACSDLVVTIVANAISLTPGTLTLEVRRLETPTLYVHVLHLHDVGAARRDVARLTAKVNAAFPSARTVPDGPVPADEEGTP
jgi:multicomponent Na+:H+ antiporter subunit E